MQQTESRQILVTSLLRRVGFSMAAARAVSGGSMGDSGAALRRRARPARRRRGCSRADRGGPGAVVALRWRHHDALMASPAVTISRELTVPPSALTVLPAWWHARRWLAPAGAVSQRRPFTTGAELVHKREGCPNQSPRPRTSAHARRTTGGPCPAPFTVGTPGFY
jgi:hypothetical protein